MITTLTELYVALDDLFGDISAVCRQCTDADCLGYLWLLPEEAEALFDSGIEILEVNKSLTFINPFSAGEKIDIERLKPSCPWCQNRRCQIRPRRPLVCRMYPLNFTTENGMIYLVLHLDCRYAQQHKKNGKFRQQAIDLFRRLDQRLFTQILDTFSLVDAISKFPAGPNRYLKLIDIGHLRSDNKKRR